MNTILKELIRKCVLVFFDEILVYNVTLNDHINHLQHVENEVLHYLKKGGPLLSLAKIHHEELSKSRYMNMTIVSAVQK